MNNKWKLILFILILNTVTIWLAVLTGGSSENIKIVACDVGQGDAILATYKNYQVLIDGGPNDRVINCLSKYMGFWDRNIELVILTHPQTDHFTGLVEVYKRYTVDLMIANNLDSGTQEYKVLKSLVGGSDTKVITPETGVKMRLGLIYLDILHPSKKFLLENTQEIAFENTGNKTREEMQASTKGDNVLGAFTSNRDPNDFSIVAVLSFKDFDALLTGDIGPKISDVLSESGQIKDVDYIKIPHHGSKNGLSNGLLEATMPEIAVISAGKNNRYGHPHQEIIKLLTENDTKILGTYELGDVVVESDGEKIWLGN